MNRNPVANSNTLTAQHPRINKMKKKETVFYISYLKHTIHFEKFQFNSKQRCYQQNDREKKIRKE